MADPISVEAGLREALTGLVALYETDEGTRALPEYIAARAALANDAQSVPPDMLREALIETLDSYFMPKKRQEYAADAIIALLSASQAALYPDDVFDILEALKLIVPSAAAGFARGTGGVSADFIVNEIRQAALRAEVGGMLQGVEFIDAVAAAALAASGREQGAPCENCGKPVEVGHVVIPYDDVGEMHADCARPFDTSVVQPDDAPNLCVLLGQPMLQVPLAALHLTPSIAGDSVVVSRVPTEAMVAACAQAQSLPLWPQIVREVYDKMIAAAPDQPDTPEGER